MDPLPSGRATRRELFAAGFAAPAAAAAGAVWSAPQAQAATGDSGVLRGILSAELLAVFCYERVLASGTLPSNTASTARQFLGQERAHVRALSAELRRLGSALPAPPANAAQADKALDLLHGSASLSAL